nr:malate dehydrogenase, cytoplasmic [Quercus suber]
MEMTDAAFPLLKDVEVCKDVNIAVILGGYPWKKITLRKDMLSTNVFIYKAQALALEEHATVDCKVTI